MIFVHFLNQRLWRILEKNVIVACKWFLFLVVIFLSNYWYHKIDHQKQKKPCPWISFYFCWKFFPRFLLKISEMQWFVRMSITRSDIIFLESYQISIYIWFFFMWPKRNVWISYLAHRLSWLNLPRNNYHFFYIFL